MRISYLKLVNFKSYKNQIFEFPPSREDKNLILVGGLNGFGKTSFLEALYLGLYGAQALHYLGRAGFNLDKKKENYSKFLNRAFCGIADTDSMSITIEFVDDDNNGYRITRTWHFDNNRHWDGDTNDIRVFSVQSGVCRRPVNPDEWDNVLANDFLPANLAPFFFFDGEEIKELAAESMVKQVKVGIETFLGVVELYQLQKRLREYNINRGRNVTEDNKDTVKRLDKELQSLDLRIKKNEEKENELHEKQKTIEREIQRVQDRMITLGGSDGSIASIKSLTEDINTYRNLIDATRKELSELLCKKLALHLMASTTVHSFFEQARREQATRQWRRKCAALEAQREKFLASFMAMDAYTPPLDEIQKGQMRKAVCTAWEGMFFPMPADCAEKCLHDYLSDDQLKRVSQLYEKTRVGRREIFAKRDELASHERQLQSLNMQLAKLEGLDSSGKLVEELKADMEKYTGLRDACIKEQTTVENQLIADRAAYPQKKAEYEKAYHQYMQNVPMHTLLDRARRIENFIVKKLIPGLYPVKKKQLQEELTRVFRTLSHKHHVECITLDDNATAHLWGKDGKELDFDKSAGESQIFATALILALANLSGLNAPMIVDTPLGRLDSLHREKMLQFWTETDRQVILLSQDEEIDRAQFEQLKPFILKSYLLTHTDMGKGIGLTVAREGYF